MVDPENLEGRELEIYIEGLFKGVEISVAKVMKMAEKNKGESDG